MTTTVFEIDRDNPALIDYRDCPMFKTSTRFWAAYADDELAMIWGIAPNGLISDTAYIWSVSFPAIKRIKRDMLRISRQWIAAMAQEYPVLVGTCDMKTTLVKHLGATFGQKVGGYHNFEIKV